MAAKKKPPTYIYNTIMQSPLTGQYYFVKKARVLDTGVALVVGKKVDVTESMKALFGPMLKREQERFLKSVKRKRAQTAH